jgi:cytochrome c biogenesis factor
MSNIAPVIGSGLVLLAMMVASCTFAMSLSAGRTGNIRRLTAARFGAHATSLLIGAAMMCLAYAMVTHDFSVAYVARYSDREMPPLYLLAALWGGQAGSLLLWLLVLAIYASMTVGLLETKHLELQPYVIATLMAVMVFFCVLVTFEGNPFATTRDVPVDGEGLNPLLQNVHMLIHPPCLVFGYAGCVVPFAFAVAALATGRLDVEWLRASRGLTLVALSFLALGTILGMRWAYEMLGWGGYFAWDPVQNGALLPLLSLVAFVHGAMAQEKRGTSKVSNVLFACATFLLTIFGTFIDRSGIVPSVHAYAQSSIGSWIGGFIALVGAACGVLVVRRWCELRGERSTHTLDSPRDLIFRIGTWVIALTLFVILVATIFPLVSRALWNETIVVGPRALLDFVRPLGLLLVFLMVAGTVVSRARRATGQRANVAARSRRRRIRGLLAHVGVLAMVVGFAGKSWDVDRDMVLDPGQTDHVGALTLEYAGARTVVGEDRRSTIADVLVKRDGDMLGTVSPSKVVYAKTPDSPTTHIAILRSLRQDVSVVVGSINPVTQRAALQVSVRPLVSFVWLGGLLVVLGCLVSIYPSRLWKRRTSEA